MFLKIPQFLRANGQWLDKQQNTILSAALVITIFNVVSALSGIIKQRYYISQFFNTPYATSDALDALLVGSQLPEVVFQLIIYGAISAAFIPIFIEYRREDAGLAFRITKAIMTLLLLGFILASIPIFIFARPLTLLRTGEAFTPEQVDIVVNLTRITILSNFFLAISSFYGALLQSYQRFILPALAPVLYNVGILLGVFFLAPTFGVYSAGIGMVIGAFLHMIIQIPMTRKLGYAFRPSFEFKLDGVKRIIKLMPPRVLSISVGELRALSLGFFATSIGNSSMLIMQLALSVMAAPIRFFGVPISQAALPFFSEEVARKDVDKFKSMVVQSVNQITFLIIPASILILILRIPIVRILFGAANFPWSVTVATGWAVAIIALSISAQAIVQLLVRAFYALKDTKTPFIIALVDMLLYLVICGITTFVLNWGVLGIAFATSITAIIEFILNLVFLHRRIHCFDSKEFLLPQVKIIAAGFLMAIFLYLPFRIFDEIIFNTTRTIELIGLTITTGTIGMLVYLYFAMLFDIKELRLFTKLASSFGPWRKPLEKSQETIVDPTPANDTDTI